MRYGGDCASDCNGLGMAWGMLSLTVVPSRLLIAAAWAAGLAWSSPPAAAAPGAVAQADSAGAPDRDGRSVATDRARGRVLAAIRQRDQARAQQAELARVYESQLAAIDRLKQQRPSWRRDRQIRERMGQSHATARRLAAIEERVRDLDDAVQGHMRALVQAIDRELAGGPASARRAQLRGWRRSARRALRPEIKKIVIPDDSIDPLADPEELDYQASLLRQSEEQLARELDRLERQVERYQHMAALRKKRSRAAELSDFDDSQPRRTTGRTGSANREADPAGAADPPAPAEPPGGPEAPTQDGDTSADPGGDFSESPMFDLVLADVVDASTVRALRAAELSSDPAVKARAARRALGQVEDRLERLKKRREIIQRRAKKLR